MTENVSDEFIKSVGLLINGKPLDGELKSFVYEHDFTLDTGPTALINDIEFTGAQLTFTAKLTRSGRKIYMRIIDESRGYKLINRRGRNRLELA